MDGKERREWRRYRYSMFDDPHGTDRVLAALFALASGATAPDGVIYELGRYGFEISPTSLPGEQA